jgi:hypothetical protein
MTEDQFSKVAVLFGVVTIVGIAFTGGAVTYGQLSDTESGGGTIAAAGNFETAGNTATATASGNTATCSGNTDCDGTAAAIVVPTELPGARVATEWPG